MVVALVAGQRGMTGSWIPPPSELFRELEALLLPLVGFVSPSENEPETVCREHIEGFHKKNSGMRGCVEARVKTKAKAESNGKQQRDAIRIGGA